ncbi:hypothetical protein [Psychroserpens algicola]|uniref:CBM-cenC domain-containing protein n=1 Tax=Psychroserpens algicola TaxID=1719034 RepID=A0ABT0H9H8_9FLAO|nr:hypothetical protein [Psychroserpens algicola]MCK8481041.1 hypothetical protein [Psychroserpens algicola]
MEAQVLNFHLVVPQEHLLNVGEYAIQQHGKLQAYSGTQAIKQFGIDVEGSGATAKGHLNGKITCYDYKAIYKVFQLDDSESADYWFVTYKKSTSHDELKLVNSNTTTTTVNYDLDFTLQGNDWGQTAVYITYKVIRLTVDGVNKDYVVTNNASAGANNSDGSKYQGGFKAQ